MSAGRAGPGEAGRVEAAAAFLRARLGQARWREVRLALVLGSGLRSFAAGLAEATAVPFAEVPHWPVPQVEGHGAALVVGRAAGRWVACLTGRSHLYEGHAPADVVRAVRTLRVLGAREFLLTNAAGGIADGLQPGDLMAITDHLNLTGSSPLVGPAEPALGPRFPDQSAVWDAGLRDLLLECGRELRQGVYAGLLGPAYETPAEVRMLKALGADAVGMSTVHEAIALGAMGARLCGLSLVSNRAAGLSGAPLRHADVVAAGARAAAELADLVGRFCGRL